ncbi:gamma-aminobutyric acid type b receptor subunit 2, partial [Plakobranchus ocellatus]
MEQFPRLVSLLCVQAAVAFASTTNASQDVNATANSSQNGLIPLYIGTLQPTSGHWWSSYGRYYVDFLQWIFDDINSRQDILPGYELRLEWRDTRGQAGMAARQMFELLTTGPPKLALCGVGLSDELLMVGNVAQYYNLPLLSFSAKTSNSLSRDGFPSVYITNYLAESANPPFLAILDTFKWTRVATLIYKDVMFETQMQEFHALLRERNISLVTSAVVTDYTTSSYSLKLLKQFDARIIVGAFRSIQAPYIFCEAYRHGLYGPSFLWLLTGGSMYDGWIETFYNREEGEFPKIPCTRQQLVEASHGYLAVDEVYLRPDRSVVTVAGMTASEYQEHVTNFSSNSPNRESRSSPYAYDAAWALALTLNRTQMKLSQGILGATRLEDFDYSRKDMFDLILASLEEITFEGVSGEVSFLASGRRVGPHLITRYSNDVKTLVGIIDTDKKLVWQMSHRDLFYGYKPPRDRVIYVIKRLPPSTAAVTVVLATNCVGIFSAVGFLAFNIVYRKNSSNSPNRESRSSPYAYDAAWALALTLNRTQMKLSQGILGATRLEDFDYSRKDMFDLILASLEEITFEGVSGEVSFLASGRRVGPHLITRYSNDVKTLVGIIDTDKKLVWQMSHRDLFYGRYTAVLLGVIYVIKRLPPSTAAVTVVLATNSVGIFSAVGFLAFNIVYRKNSNIKMSSPTINNVIVLGALLMYMFVFTLTTDYAQWSDVHNSAICSIQIWLACTGFTVAFGALFSKTWRVHALFRQSQLKRKVIRDARLLSNVLLLVLADMVILIPWTAVNTLVKEEHEQPAEEESTLDRRVTYKYTTCTHPKKIYWYMAEYVFKGLLLVFGAFLAWETREVRIPALNDSKLIGFCIYNIAVFCALAVPVVHVLGQERLTLTFLVVGLFVSLCTTLVLCILFIPKVRLRHKISAVRFFSSFKGSDNNSLNNQLPTRPVADQALAGSRMDLVPEVKEQVQNNQVTCETHIPQKNDIQTADPNHMITLAVPDRSTGSKQLSTSSSSLTDQNETCRLCPVKLNSSDPGRNRDESAGKSKDSLIQLQAEVERLNACLAK